MEISRVTEFARALYDSHGDKAEAEAAKKAKEYEEAGEERDAADWNAIRAAIRTIRGANQS